MVKEKPRQYKAELESFKSFTHRVRDLVQLENDKLITRKVYAEVPPRVEYSLSEMGEKFRKVLDQIELFGFEYIKEIEKAEG